MRAPDVVIIGAGIIGAAAALELARAGMRVVVLDRQQPAQEASWAAAGMLAPAPESAEALPLVPLGRASLALYPEFVAAVERASGQPVGFRRHGTLHVYFGDGAVRDCERAAEEFAGLGFAVRPLTAAEARALEPALNPAAAAALLLPEEASVNNRALTAAVLAAAARAGVEIRAGAAVTRVRVENSVCVGVELGAERLDAGAILAAAGCYTAQIPPLERYAPTRPVRGQMAALRLAERAPVRTLRSARGYLVPRPDGRWIAGSTSERAGFEKRVTPEGIAGILAAAAELVPELARAELVETWAGLRPDTPDHLPVLGPTDIEGLHFATGHYRNGILLAPITARLVREWLTTGRTSLPIELYSPLRFRAETDRR